MNGLSSNEHGNMHDEQSSFRHTISLGTSFGQGENSILVSGFSGQYSLDIDESINFTAKLTTLSQTGNDITTFGLSDIYLSSLIGLTDNFSITAGVKLPLTDGNEFEDGEPLPMHYQTSLGTVDLIIGASLQIQEFHVVVALQQPLTQNENMFIADSFIEGSPLREFQTTSDYERSGDILARISYPVITSQDYSLTATVLPIYHLQNDTFADTNNERREIEGSQGLTLNLGGALDYRLTTGTAVQVNIGFPIIARDAQPDGLLRAFMMNAEYRITL
jgi:hypothetical protein